MGKRGAPAEGHQAAKRRSDADSHHVFQLARHFVGHGVGGGLEDLVFGHGAVLRHEIAACLHGEIGEIHGAAHDVDLIVILHPAHVLDDLIGRNQFDFGRAVFHVRQPAGSGFLDADPLVAAFGDALKDPLHAIHRAGEIEIRFEICYPPELDLVGLEIGNEQRRVAGSGDQRRQRALGGNVKISDGIDDVDVVKQDERVELAQLQLRLDLLHFALIPRRRKAIRQITAGNLSFKAQPARRRKRAYARRACGRRRRGQGK